VYLGWHIVQIAAARGSQPVMDYLYFAAVRPYFLGLHFNPKRAGHPSASNSITQEIQT